MSAIFFDLRQNLLTREKFFTYTLYRVYYSVCVKKIHQAAISFFSSNETKSQVSFTDHTSSIVCYSSYSFPLILLKLGIYDHWASALRKCVRIRNLTPGALRG